MISFVYGLCALTALVCAALLLRGYARTGSQVLWWSGLCFSGLMLSNVVLVLDKIVFPDIDMLPWRLWLTLISMLMLLYGLIYANE